MVVFGSIALFAEMTNLPSFELVFIRCLSATLFLGSCWLISGQYRNEEWNSKEVLQTLACGIFLVFNWGFIFKSFETTSITVAISVYNLAPVLMLLLGSIFYREKLKIKSVFSILLCFLGTVFISDIDFSAPFKELLPVGVLWALAGALFNAFMTLLGKGITKLSPYATTFLQTGLGIMIIFPFIQMGAFSTLTFGNWTAAIATGIIHTGITFLLFFDSLRFLSTKVISILVFLNPAIAILLDTIIIGFRPNLIQTMGIILIFSGIALTLIKSKKGIEQKSNL
ncbi:EamA family transporter [Bacillus toyonensis]|uniref:EamA family transporter n=2 Tax=Bacillus toyonensis TaxID=155322 RepID=A0A2A8H941_9BACI|nr:EamA family transporter [Bacillus toyonensis]